MVWKSRYLAFAWLAFVLISPGIVLAHAKMSKSVPAEGSIAPVGTSEIDLSFTKPMRLTLVRLLKLPEEEKLKPTSELPKTFVQDASVSIPPLSAGQYEVHWTAMGKDGHLMRGKFSFSVDEK